MGAGPALPGAEPDLRERPGVAQPDARVRRHRGPTGSTTSRPYGRRWGRSRRRSRSRPVASRSRRASAWRRSPTSDHYFQNNNALDPNIGTIRPEPIPRVQEGDSLMVNWYAVSAPARGRRLRHHAGAGAPARRVLARRLGDGPDRLVGRPADAHATGASSRSATRTASAWPRRRAARRTRRAPPTTAGRGSRSRRATTWAPCRPTWSGSRATRSTATWTRGATAPAARTQVAFPSELTLGASVAPSSRVRVAADLQHGRRWATPKSGTPARRRPSRPG